MVLYLSKPVWNEVTRDNLWDGMIERGTELTRNDNSDAAPRGRDSRNSSIFWTKVILDMMGKRQKRPLDSRHSLSEVFL